MAKMPVSLEDRVAYLERFIARLVPALEKNFRLRMAPDDAAAPGDDAIDLDGMTIAQLRELAAARSIDLNGKTVKADIIAAIEAASIG